MLQGATGAFRADVQAKLNNKNLKYLSDMSNHNVDTDDVCSYNLKPLVDYKMR